MKKARFVPAQFLIALEESLRSISEAVLYGGVLPDDPVIQQEYQKRLRHHGIKIRPDIIVHQRLGIRAHP